MRKWKEIKGFEGIYAVNEDGKVLNLTNGKILKNRKHKTGYLSVILYKDKKYKSKLVHRLVAEAFLSREEGKPFVNHKDENKENNCIENLEWCSKIYNSNYGTISQRIKNRRGHEPRRKKPIIQKDKNGNIIQIWDSIGEASRATKTARNSIFECCRGKNKTANGFMWNYANK